MLVRRLFNSRLGSAFPSADRDCATGERPMLDESKRTRSLDPLDNRESRPLSEAGGGYDEILWSLNPLQPR